MQAAISTARQARERYRHHLHTLTYVILDEANGGIVRNLSHRGVAVQAVGALRVAQNVRMRFELRNPRVRIEARGEVVWANSSGQCGIRFLDLPPRMVQQVNQWILGNLLESAPESMLADVPIFDPLGPASARPGEETEENDGLLVSAAPRKAIKLDMKAAQVHPIREHEDVRNTYTLHRVDRWPEQTLQDQELQDEDASRRDWLSQPLSGRSLAWTVDSLMVFAALLLFSLVFLSVTHELPKWPRATGVGAAALMAGFYWTFFRAFGGVSLGNRLARLAAADQANEREPRDRFR
jgi:hypothetical protein